jgi:hypothetical protein
MTLFAILFSTLSINASPVFIGINDAVLNIKAVSDATFRKPAVFSGKNNNGHAIKAANVFALGELSGTVEKSVPLATPFFSTVTSTTCPTGIATITYSGTSIQTFDIPTGVTTVTIRTIGANGGDKTTGALIAGGKGAIMQGTFGVTGSKLYILTGKKGDNEIAGGDEKTGGGGGGTFVFGSSTLTEANLLIAAGGGGGAGMGTSPSGVDLDGAPLADINANTSTRGNYGGNIGVGGGAGSYGLVKYGGESSSGGAGGAGINGDGEAIAGAEGYGGSSPGNGGYGGGTTSPDLAGYANGGYGGGGASFAGGGGGGGGYSGGGGGALAASGSAYGGGGGSYIGTTNGVITIKGTGNTTAYGTNDGLVVITWSIPCASSLLPGSIGSPQTICSGLAPSAFTSTSAASGGTGTITYQWQSSADNTTFTDISGATSSTYAPSALTTTTYYRRGAKTATDAVQYTSSVKITVNPLPTVTAGNNSPVCVGTTLNLTSSGSFSSYSWTGPNSFSSTLQNPSISSVTSAAGGTYSVLVTDANGCKNTATTAVVVNPLPTVVVSPTSVSIVNGLSTTLTASGVSTYTWSPSTGLSATTGATVTATPITTTTYTVTGTAANSCVNTSLVPVTVTYAPATALNFDGVDDKVVVNNSTLGNFGTGDFTIEMSVRTALSSGVEYLASKRNFCGGDNFWSLQIVNGKLNMEMAENAASLNYVALLGHTLISDGQWHHVALTRQLGNVNIYVDGVLETTSNATIANLNNSYVLEFGSSICNVGNAGNNGSVKFKGDMDEIRIWNRALCTAELDSYRHCELTLPQTGLQAYYKLNAGFINANNAVYTTAVDETGTNNATLSNTFGLTGATSNWVAGTVNQTSCTPYTTAAQPITGTATVCVGNTTQLANSSTGGTWTSSNTSVATVNLTSGLVTGVSAGTVTITYTSLCGAVSTLSVTVNPLNTIATGVNRTACINTAITNITLATTGATGATVAGLPTGVTGSWAGDVVTISGTPTASGVFNYTVTTTGGCPSTTATGTFTVTANNTIALTSAAGTDVQSKCVLAALTNITYSTTGATGATFSGLPLGVTGSWSGNVVTISGTATVPGTYNYTVTLTGGCGAITANGTITIALVNAIVLTSGLGSDAQTKCISTPITPITYSTVGATDATFSGLPSGVTGSWASNVVTISGTPTVAGTYNYTVTLTGGCGNVSASGSITVTALTTPIFNQVAAICSGATLAALPTTSTNNIQGTWSPAVNNLSTTTYTFTPNAGQCAATATMTIAVNPLPSNFTTSGGGSYCAGGTGLSVFNGGSTIGVNYDLKLDGNVVATVAGTGSDLHFNNLTAEGTYTIQATDQTTGCTKLMSGSATIIVTPLTTPTFTQVAAICSGTSLSALPTTSNNGVAGTWSPALNNLATTTYTFTPDAGQCATTATMTITVNPLPTITQIFPTCAGGSRQLSGTGTPAATNPWTSSDPSVATVNNTGLVTGVTVAGGNTVITYTNANGCSITTNFTVYSTPPTPTVSVVNNCDGTSTLTASGFTGYQWVFTGPVIATSASITVSTPGTYKVRSASANCVSSFALATAAPKTTPATPVIATPNGVSSCFPLGVTVTASGASNYIWSGHNGTSSGNTATTNNTPGTYSVTVSTTVNGCTSTSAAVILTVNPQPIVYNVSGGGSYCTGGSGVSIGLSNTEVGVNYALTLNSVPTGVVLAGTGSALTFGNVTTGGTYNILATNPTTGCSSNMNGSVNVAVNPLPTVSITNNSPVLCEGNTAQLFVNVNATTGTWSSSNPSVANTESPFVSNFVIAHAVSQGTAVITYTYTDANGCTGSGSTSISVNARVTPTFTQVAAICSGASLSALPTTSDNGIPGTWSPAINNTATTTYTFVPNFGQCASATTMTIAVNTNVTPTFTQVAAICSGASLSALPTTSTNSITGTWSPALNNTATTTYTFTPTAGQCATTTTMTVIVNPTPATPVITGPTSFCEGYSTVLNSSSETGNHWSNGQTDYGVSVFAPGTFILTVTDGNGCSATSAPVTVTVNPQPTVTVSPGSTTYFCEGGSVTFTASGTNINSYQWKLDGTNISGANASSYTAAVSGNYSVLVSSIANCSIESGPILVTVNPYPAVPTITRDGPTVFCSGGSVVLTANGGSNYQWSNGFNGSSILVNTNVPGTYTYTVTSNNNGCSTVSAPVTVTVNPTPTASISVGGPTTFCAGGSVLLTAIVTDGNMYQWKLDGNPISGANGLNYTASASGNYSVAVTSPANCFVESLPVSVTVNPYPPVPVINQPTSTSGCSPLGITLTATGASNYSWSTGNTNGNMTTINNVGTYTVTVSTFINGCTSTSAPITVTVNPLPNVTITAAGPTALCYGGSVVLNATPTGTGYAYQWKINNNDISEANNASFTATQSGVYTVTVTSPAGCSVTGGNVTVSVAGQPHISTGITTVCAGSSVGLLTDLTTGVTFQWQKDGVDIPMANTSTTVTNENGTFVQSNYNATVSGSYTVVETNIATGCSASSNAIVATVNPLPATPTITGNSSYCAGSNVALTSSSATAYRWNFGPNSQSVNVGAGTYTVTVFDANNCSSTSAPFTVIQNPSPTITGAPAVCVNSSINLTGSGTPAISNAWTSSNTVNALVSNTGVVSGRHAGPTTITYTNSNGCSQSMIITVNALPTVAINTSGPIPFCSGSSVTLTQNLAPGITYSWLPNGETTPSITVTTAGTYTLKAVDPVTGCSDTRGLGITVNPLPPTPTISGISTFCAGSGPVVLTSSSATGNLWSNGPNSQTDNVGAGTYTVTVTDANNCKATSAPFTVTANPTPTATISGSTTVCKNAASPSITFTGSNGTAPYTFTYQVNGGSLQTVTTVSGNSVTVPVSTTTAGGFTYLLTSVRESSSTACSANASGTASVVVSAPPIASISGTSAVCIGATNINLNINGGGGTAPYTFTYTINGGVQQTVTTVSGNTATVPVNTTTAGSFIYQLVSVQEGSANACIALVSNSSTVVINPLPTASVSASTAGVCLNGAIPVIRFAGSGGTAPYTISYKINGGTTQSTLTTGNLATVPVSTTTAGSFTYSLVSVRDAGSSACINGAAGSVTVTVYSIPPAPSISVVDNCNGTSTLTAGNIVMGANYHWSTGDNNMPSISVNVAGTYALQQSANGCLSPLAQADANPKTIPVIALTSYAANTNVCDGDVYVSVTTETTQYSGPGVSYNWTVSGPQTLTRLSNGAEGYYILNSNNTPGTYTFTLAVTVNGCTSNTSNTITVVVPTWAAPVLPDLQAECSIDVTAPVINNACGQPVTGTTSDPLAYTEGDYIIHWTFTDVSGNRITATQTVSVHDVTPPIITVPGDITHTANDGACSFTFATQAAPSDSAPTGPVAGLAPAPSGSAAPPPGPVAGPAPEQSSGSTPSSNPTPPSAPVYLGFATATDNCSAVVTGVRNDGLQLTDAYPVGVTTILWTATDPQGHTATGTQTVTITDDEFPVVVNTPDPIVTVADAGKCGAILTWSAVTVTDNCPGPTLVESGIPANNIFPIGITTVTYTGTDAHGHVTTTSFTVTVTDDQAPVPTVFDLPTITGQCSAHADAPTATDNCTGSITGSTLDPTDYTAQGVYTITWTYSDDNGNTTTQLQRVCVKDDIVPHVITRNVTVYLDNNGEATITTTQVDNGSADNCTIVSYNLNKTHFNCSDVGINTVTLSVTDGAGNIGTATANVSVIDNLPPVPDIPVLADIVTECAVFIPNADYPTATDLCGHKFTATADMQTSFNQQGTYTITWTYHNGNGNDVSQTQNVIVRDITAPNIIVCVSNQTILLGSNCSAVLPDFRSSIAAADNCTHSSDLIITQTPVAGTVLYGAGTTTVSFTVADAAGNKSNCSMVVTTKDVTPPTFTCPANITTTATTTSHGTAGTNVNYAATNQADNCGVLSTTYSPASGSFFNVGTTPVTVTVTDVNGLVSTCIFNVTVDCVLPLISTLPNLTANTTANACSAPVTYSSSATGTGTIALTYVMTGATTGSGSGDGSGTVFNKGVTTVTITATNICGSTSKSFTVTITDNVAPVPTVTTLPTITGQCSAHADAPKATDNCAGSLTGSTLDPTDYTAQGVYTITWTYSDGNGNTTTQLQRVCVKDVTPPTVTCPANVTATATTTISGTAGAYVTYGTATATDNCGMQSITYSTPSGSFFNIGINTVTVTATDVNGNKSTCTFTVTVNCTIPVITCPANITASTITTGCSATPSYTVSATGIPAAAITYTFTGATTGSGTGTGTGASFNKGVTTVTITATNACGSVSKSFTVTVVDDVKPTITCPAAVTIACGLSATPSITGTATATDNCGTVTVTYSDVVIANITTRTWTATDASNNSSSCVQVITLSGPFVSTIASVPTSNVYTGAGMPSTTLFLGYGAQSTVLQTNVPTGSTYTYVWTGSDAAMLSSTTSGNPLFTPTHGGSYAFTVTASNALGCNSTASVTICVTDIRVLVSNVKNDDDDKQKMCDHSAHDASDCPHKGHNHTCDHKAHTKYSCPHRDTNDKDDDDEKDCDHKAHAAKDCSHNGHNHKACDHKAHAAKDCDHDKGHASDDQKVCDHKAHNASDCSHDGHNHKTCDHKAHAAKDCVHNGGGSNSDGDSHNGCDDDKQKMCNHEAHDASECSHKGHNHKPCDHKAHSKYECDHRDTNDKDDDDEKDCDHKAHDAKDCSHKGHNHKACDHKAHNAKDCDHDKSNSSDEKVCDHKAHDAKDCSHKGHNHTECDHKAHDAKDCAHNDDNNGCDDTRKVYICHVPPGNPGKTITLSISINAVAAHLANHPGDRLGSCDQQPCSGFTDNVKPTIDCPASITVSCGSSTSPTVTGSAEASDNSGFVNITYTDVNGSGFITRTWKATDASGNFSTCTQTITVAIPFTTSIISTPNSNVNTGGVSTNLYLGYGAQNTTLSVSGSLPSSGAPYTYSWSGNGISNSSASSIVFTPTIGGSYTITLVTTNKSGCSNSSSITICVKDIRERDRFNVLTNSGKVYVCHLPPGNIANVQTICISVNAVPAHVPLHGGDRLGSCDQICGTDVISKPPVITCPGDKTVTCISATTPSLCGSATGIDNSGRAAIMTYSDDVNNNVITRTWTASDASGNYTNCIQIITVIDNVKPVISCPGDKVVGCGGSTDPVYTGYPTATDNCSTPTVTYTDVTGANGVISRTWKATDAAGNYSTCMQTITKPTSNPCALPYPFVDVNYPRTSVLFNESDILRATEPGANTVCGITPTQIKLWFNDEHPLTLGVRQVVVKTKTGTTTTNYPVTTYPGTATTISNPSFGSTYDNSSDQSGNDVANAGGRPLRPVMYISDITNDPNNRTGDWQHNGTPYNANRISGSWKSAVRVVDKTQSTTVVTVVPDADPSSKNNWSMGTGGDIAPAGLISEGYGAEIVWNVSSLGLLPGHTYRLQFIVHDGDQNKAGGDAGQSCAVIYIPTSTTVNAAPPVPTQIINSETAVVKTTEEELKVTVMPNPTTTFFTLKFESKYETPISMRVMDGRGRVVDAKSRIGANSTIQIGHNYSSGTYYAEMIQGTKRKVVQLIKGRG